jgi:aminopeptidase N
MMRIPFLCLAGLCLFSTGASAGTGADAIECDKSALLLASTDSSGHRKYAADRDVQVLHLAIDVTPNFQDRTIAASTVIRFKPLALPAREIKLDAVDFTVQSVTSSEKIQAYQVTSSNIIVTFSEPIPADKEASVTVAYTAAPAQGLYFRTPEMGYKPGDTHLFSQGESIEARHWYPCLDAPDQKFTSEITCRLPQGMVSISNGRLVSEEKDAASGLMVSHWSQDQPHANYLISLVAGYFNKLEDKHRDVPLTFYTPPSEFKEATNSFRDTRDIMAFFEEEIGVPYPWAKYSQVCVNDFVAGGMENTSATTLTDSTLFTDATENINDSESLVSHEMAHQWFGDLVTCKDWTDIWLNEGFATYYETLYNGHKNGRDAMRYELYQRIKQITGMSNDTNSVVRRTYDSPEDMFGYLAYPKGGWVLHMLRAELGTDLYRRCIKTYLERHRYGNVVTEDLRAVIEELSGRSYDQFFDQWVYHAHNPELECSYSWDEKSRLAKLSVRQAQAISDAVLLFNVPLTVRFKTKSSVTDRVIRVTEKQEDFYFQLDSTPELVRLDPELSLFAKISFPVPNGMLALQLADDKDVIGRLLAIEQISPRHDKEAVEQMKHALNNDSFYGVRIEAARALRSMHTDESLDALLASTNQPDARVRRQVVSDLGAFYSDKIFAADRQILETEKNPAIQSAAIDNLGAYAKPETRDLLVKFLNTPSFHNEVAVAATVAMRSQDDPTNIAPLMEALSAHESDYTSRGLARGLGTLAYLARNEDKKDAVREFLIARVNDKRKSVQTASIDALATLGDPKALGVLETFANASKESQEGAAAQRAVATLRAARKPVDDFKNLRQEVMDLEKANRELHQQLADLKKKVESIEPAATVSTPKKKSRVPAAKSGEK